MPAAFHEVLFPLDVAPPAWRAPRARLAALAASRWRATTRATKQTE